MSTPSTSKVGDITSTSSTSGLRKVTQKRLAHERTRYFKNIVEGNGVILSNDDRPNILTKEQSLVIRDIEKALTQNDDEPLEFIASFKTYSKKTELLHKLLLPTVLLKGVTEIPDSDSLSGLIQQESLIRIFFQVNCIQSEIMEFILEAVTDLVSEENEEGADFRLMLSAMKYLPFIHSSDILTQKLLDMIEIGTFGAQLEILNSIPDIIPDAQYESMAKQLIRILENNNELTGAIVDCLNSLNLSSNTRLEIQQYIIDRLLSSASIHEYPILFDFLTSDCKPINLPAILLKCRDPLNEIMKNERVDKERESKKVVIMKKLHMSTSLKVQYEGWMNLFVNIRNFNAAHKPVDIIILIMLHSTATNRKQSVEKLIKRHVKAGLLKKQHLEVVFQKYFIKQIFQDYFQSIIEIASGLIRHPMDILSTEFASAIFILLFENENIDRVQRQDIIHTLILLTSNWDSKNVGDILKILLDLSKGDNLQNHVAQLMGLLEKVDSFELKDIKQVYELLCSMTCSAADEANSNLKDELHMLIRKQISSAKRHLKQRGIVAAIVMAGYIATTSEEQELSDNDDSFSDISGLPPGAPQESARTLELASNAASSFPELMGLYYDQLSSMLVRASNLDKHFMGWLQENVQREFESTFTIREPPERINDIPIYSQYCLNEDSEMIEQFSVNIAALTMQPTHLKSIMLLAPMFRMFRTLCQKNLENLDTIDALLGCGVALPELEDISFYNMDQMKLVADSLFHCINWFRETISAFIKCSNKKLRIKLIDRLAHLVQLEDHLNKCLEYMPNHKLPCSYFYNALTSVVRGSPVKTKPEAKLSRPRKKMKTITGEALDFLNETVASTSIAPTRRKKGTSTLSKRSTHHIPKPEFREIDTDLIILLKYPLNLSNDADSISSQQTTIDMIAFQYVLSDIVGKLNLIVNNKNLGMSNLNDINPVRLITDCVRLSPNIYANFMKISKEIAALKEKVDERDDHVDLYTTEAKTLKSCFYLTLEYFMLLFSWSGFGNTKNLNLLRDYLKALVEETSSQSAAHLSREVTNKLITCADQCLHLQPAVCLVKAMQALYKINSENHEVKKKIAAVSGKFLNKKWYNTSGDVDGGKVLYENLDVLLKAYLDGASVKTISGIVGTLQKQAGSLQTKDDYLEMLESINKANFHVLYRNLCNCTLDRIILEINSLTNNEHLILWKTTGVIMQGLMIIVTAQSTKNNYSIFLRKSTNILNVFLSHGIPILEIMLKSKTDEVVEILKTLQTTTRFLHHLCCTSKLAKDTSVMAYVPKFKQTLETLVFRVKGALIANDCSKAFWMGNLKNKDLDGEEILTQSTLSTAVSQNDEDEEEELPSEDSDGDILEPEGSVQRNGEERSASEIYD